MSKAGTAGRTIADAGDARAKTGSGTAGQWKASASNAKALPSVACKKTGTWPKNSDASRKAAIDEAHAGSGSGGPG